MLNVFRRRERLVRYVLGGLLFLVCAAMVVTLIPGITGSDSDPLVGDVVAQVGADKISSFDLQQTVLQASRTSKIPPDMMWLYTPQVLDQMILEKASIQEAHKLGLDVSPSEVAGRLRQLPDLFPGGNFVGQDQYEAMVTDRFGLSVPQFEAKYRDGLLIEKLRDLVTDSLSVTPQEVRQEFNTENQRVVLSYAFLDPADFKKDIKPTDAELEDYFNKHKDHYSIPEKRAAKILVVVQQKVREANTASDAALRKYYDSHQDDYRVEDRVQVSHILLKADSKDPASVEKAKKKAADLEQKLKAGADFAKLAKENSDDTATAPKGGDLGWIVRKQTVPEFENAAFSLTPPAISDPIQTVYGIHILKVEAREKAHIRPFDEVKGDIQNALLEDKVQAQMLRDAEDAGSELERSPSSDMNTLAAKYHGTVLTPQPTAQDEGVEGIGPAPALQQEIFALEKGKAGQPVQVPTGYAIPVLQEIVPSHPAQFAEVKDKVKDDLVSDQARDKALTKANELAGSLAQEKTKDIKKAADALKLSIKTSEPVNQDGTIPQLGPMKQFGLKAFSMQVGDTAGPVAVNGGQVVYQIQSRQEPNEQDFAKQADQIKQRLLDEKRQLAFQVFQDSLKNRMAAAGTLKVNNDVLAKLSTASASH